MTAQIAFITGASFGFCGGLLVAGIIFAVAVWRSNRRDDDQAWEDGR